MSGGGRSPGRGPGGAPRAVLWDLDGTLVDSRAYHWWSWRAVMEREAVPITEADFAASFGRRNDEFLPEWLGGEADPERIRRVAEAKEALYRERIRDRGIVALPGAVALVRSLHTGGWRQAIASSAPRLNVEVVGRALDFAHLVETTVGAEDVRVGKPDPEVFLIAAERVGVTPRRCVVVEDASAGIEAARRAGMRCIGVGGTETGTADIVVGSLEDLPADAFERLIPREDETTS